jgi:hypothetical protein
MNILEGDTLVYYKVFRVALMVGALYIIIWYLYFTKKGKDAEKPAKRMLEEDDS